MNDWDSRYKQDNSSPPATNTYSNNQGKKFFPKKKDDSPGKIYNSFAIFSNENPPADVLHRAELAAALLAEYNFTLRTDKMNALNKPFEDRFTNLPGMLEIYAPWKDFNNNGTVIETKNYFASSQSKDIAKMFFPSFDTMKPVVQAFLSRNVRLILGEKLKSNTNLLVVWSQDGAECKKQLTIATGFLQHPLKIAFAAHIPVYNLQNPDAVERIRLFLNY